MATAAAASQGHAGDAQKNGPAAGSAHVKTDTARGFFHKIHEDVQNTDQYVHTWDGELYLEYHRGTYTSQAYNKKMNRGLENKLAQTECLSSIAYILGGNYDQEGINDSWELYCCISSTILFGLLHSWGLRGLAQKLWGRSKGRCRAEQP